MNRVTDGEPNEATVLLLGGTSETAFVAGALASAGLRVLVSTATDVPLDVGRHPNIARRHGRLDVAGMGDLVRSKTVCALVDVSHPYAVELRATARQAAAGAGIPYLTFVRPESCGDSEEIVRARTHGEAARLACAAGRPVLLTVGSRNVAVYAAEAARRGVRLVARVLPCADSLQACRAAGLRREEVETGRGPFGVEENRALVRRLGIGVVVTKDSGEAGGFPAKQEAARLEGCRLVVVGRDPRHGADEFSDLDDLVRAAIDRLGQRCTHQGAGP